MKSKAHASGHTTDHMAMTSKGRVGGKASATTTNKHKAHATRGATARAGKAITQPGGTRRTSNRTASGPTAGKRDRKNAGRGR
jgi:hypothetical protein